MAPALTFGSPLQPRDDDDIRSTRHIQNSLRGSWAEVKYLMHIVDVKMDIFISKHRLENAMQGFLMSKIRAIKIAHRNSRIDARKLKNRVREAMTLRSPLQPHDDAIQSVVHHIQNSCPDSWSEAAKNIARLSSEVDFFKSKLQQLKEQGPNAIQLPQTQGRTYKDVDDKWQQLKEQAPNADKFESEEDIHKSDKSKSKILDLIQVLDRKYEVCDLNSNASDIIHKYHDLLYDVCDLTSIVLHIIDKFPASLCIKSYSAQGN
ncbi:hypothetical protein LguiA_001935 [Lonicera macranthoides]